MARNSRKKALYEVIGKSRTVTPSGQGPSQSEAEQKKPEKEPDRVVGTGRWPRKPKLVQVNAGRVELSMPYQLVIAIVLCLVLVLMVFFRLGQLSATDQPQAVDGAGETAPGATPGFEQQAGGEAEATQPRAEIGLGQTEGGRAAGDGGDNRIVIQTYRERADLVPVKQYFAQHGIETEIIRLGQWYYLVTSDKYESVNRAGSEGYAAKQRIIELGSNYKAPAGYESFGDRPFHDAFGKKFE